jgi:hypothetical protein
VADSYEIRIAAAEQHLSVAEMQRDAAYPGSNEWYDADNLVKRWEGVIADLRTEQHAP